MKTIIADIIRVWDKAENFSEARIVPGQWGVRKEEDGTFTLLGKHPQTNELIPLGKGEYL